MDSFGKYLERERRLREISLDEIASKTKINIDYLAAIEKEDFESMPGEIFTLGFLRNYAEYIGLDGNDVINRYQMFKNTTKEEQKNEPKPDTVKEKKKSTVSNTIFIVILLVVLVAIIFLFFKGKI